MKNNLFDIDAKSTPYYYNNDRKEMLSFIPIDVQKILDIGCGEGYFGQLCKQKRNAEVWGVELNEIVAEKAKCKLDKALVGNIEFNDIDIPESYFDCIVFNDILEHLQYPWSVLVKIKKYLKYGGYIVASIPNIRYYDNMKNLIINKDWEYTGCGIMDKTHLRFFTANSIINMFARCGYHVVKLEGINAMEFSWKLNLLNKILNNHFDDTRYLQFACVAKYIEI